MSAGGFPPWLAFVLRRDFDGQPLHLTAGDSGGWTAWGVTQATAEGYARAHGMPEPSLDDMRGWTAATPIVADIYRAPFWDALSCEALPAGVDGMLFDHACGAGPWRAARLFQAILGVAQDGAIGARTLAAVARWEPAALVRRIHDERARYYASLPTFHLFGRGWDRRDDAARDLGLSEALAAAAP